MTNTALGAGAEKAQEIIFISEAHEKFYYEKLKEVRYQDVYHKALCYCLGINDDTRRNANRIYDFKTGCVKTECLHEGWQTSGSVKVVRMAFNLYCNATPSVDDYTDAEEQINECRQYTVEELFCCAYAPYFWQAIQIRYVIHKRGLKRFVEDNIGSDEIKINGENIGEHSIFYYYILYKFGESEIQTLDDKVVEQFIINLFNTRKIDSREVNMREKLEEMLREEKYSELIKLGACKIRNW